MLIQHFWGAEQTVIFGFLLRLVRGSQTEPSVWGFADLIHFFTKISAGMALVSGIRRLLEGTSTGRLLFAKEPWVAARLSPARLLCDGNVSTKLFISGLSRYTTDEGLRAAFSRFGRLIEARVVTDRASGRSKGFAFVRYATLEEAEKAREGMDGKFLDGWVIFADYAKPRPPKPPEEPSSSSSSSSSSGLNIRKTIGWCG